MWGELWLGFPHTPSLRHPLAQCESEGTWERRGQCTKRCFSPPTSSSYKWWALRSSWLPTGNISLKCRCLISCKSVHTQHHSLASIYGLTSVNKVNLNTRTTDQRWGQRSAHKQKKSSISVSVLFGLQEESVWPRPPVQHRHGNRVIRPAGAQALHHPVSGASPLQHIQVRFM